VIITLYIFLVGNKETITASIEQYRIMIIEETISSFHMFSFLLIEIISFLSMLSLHVRRLHDINYRGWWIILNFIPLLGAIFLLILSCLKGTKGPNRFGEEPK
jgi:uncharacterized membrane protein YhaH (DUF805 family)